MINFSSKFLKEMPFMVYDEADNYEDLNEFGDDAELVDYE